MTVVRAIKVSVSDGAGGYRLADGWGVWCPGCDDEHAMGVHEFNGNLDCPTFSPSLLVQYGNVGGEVKRCHSFLIAGQWQFLGDSTHALAGQTVPAVPHPEAP